MLSLLIFLRISTFVYSESTFLLDANVYRDRYETYKKNYGLKFDGPEDHSRLQIYAENLAEINRINSEGRSFTLGENEFTHMTTEEFNQMYFRNGQSYPRDNHPNKDIASNSVEKLGTAVNAPSFRPSYAPHSAAPHSKLPTKNPSAAPSTSPTSLRSPSFTPTKNSPTMPPTVPPSSNPSKAPTASPSSSPSSVPHLSSPTKAPSTTPSAPPSNAPTASPSASPSKAPTVSPSGPPSRVPIAVPSISPSKISSSVSTPTTSPSKAPIGTPTAAPLYLPTSAPVNNGGHTGDYVDWTLQPPYPNYAGRFPGPFLNPIKSQGQCGCCYAFAAVGVLEAAYYLKYGQLLSFSEQYIVSCDNQDGAGCNGGDPNFVADWVSSNGGIPLETSYPYAQLQNPNTVSCAANAGSLIPITLAADNVYYGPTLNTIEAAIKNQPVAVTIAGGSFVFKHYKSGVLADSSCNADINHVVVAVGYGTDSASGMPYIKIRNSWGTSWGTGGYGLINSAYCYIGSDLAYPNLG